VHALARTLARRVSDGFSGKHPLFPGRDGRALASDRARSVICRACNVDTMGEHSMRRKGAQFYARRGVPLSVIQHFGRWGSSTVGRYVAHALEDRASWAPIVAAGSVDLGVMLGTCSEGMRNPVGLHVLDGLVVSRVRQVLNRAARRKGKVAVESARPEAVGPVAVEALRVELKADMAKMSDELAGTLLAVRSTTKGVGHLVKFSGRALHPSDWATVCGWHFAHAPHEACTLAEVTCRRGCTAAAGQVGLAASSGNDPRAP